MKQKQTIKNWTVQRWPELDNTRFAKCVNVVFYKLVPVDHLSGKVRDNIARSTHLTHVLLFLSFRYTLMSLLWGWGKKIIASLNRLYGHTYLAGGHLTAIVLFMLAFQMEAIWRFGCLPTMPPPLPHPESSSLLAATADTLGYVLSDINKCIISSISILRM